MYIRVRKQLSINNFVEIYY
jgi:hypothetical protein